MNNQKRKTERVLIVRLSRKHLRIIAGLEISRAEKKQRKDSFDLGQGVWFGYVIDGEIRTGTRCHLTCHIC